MYKIQADEDKEIMKYKRLEDIIDSIGSRFLWFAAGVFFGYLWMARAYGLF